jgi:hypothetical protein
MYVVLKDGKARRTTEAGKEMLCGWCFCLLCMPKFGEENLRCHLASTGYWLWSCGLGQEAVIGA